MRQARSTIQSDLLLQVLSSLSVGVDGLGKKIWIRKNNRQDRNGLHGISAVFQVAQLPSDFLGLQVYWPFDGPCHEWVTASVSQTTLRRAKIFFFVFLTVLFLQSIDSLILNHGMDMKGSKSTPEYQKLVCPVARHASIWWPIM